MKMQFHHQKSAYVTQHVKYLLKFKIATWSSLDLYKEAL